MAQIGFIGLGNMGPPMAHEPGQGWAHRHRLRRQQRRGTEKFAAAGGSGCNGARCGRMGADVVITMLPAGKEVREVYLTQGGVHRARRRTARC